MLVGHLGRHQGDRGEGTARQLAQPVCRSQTGEIGQIAVDKGNIIGVSGFLAVQKINRCLPAGEGVHLMPVMLEHTRYDIAAQWC